MKITATATTGIEHQQVRAIASAVALVSALDPDNPVFEPATDALTLLVNQTLETCFAGQGLTEARTLAMQLVMEQALEDEVLSVLANYLLLP